MSNLRDPVLVMIRLGIEARVLLMASATGTAWRNQNKWVHTVLLCEVLTFSMNRRGREFSDVYGDLSSIF